MDKLKQLKEAIEAELEAYLTATDLFLVQVKVLSNGKIEVYADGNTNITIDQCTQISKHLYAFLETNGWMNDNIALEVSSPGMDEPLKVKQQFAKQLHKKVDVVLKNGMKITGELIAADEQQIVVKEEIIQKKNKTESTEEHTLAFDEIKSVKKHFNFKL
jgi:ribosome maturation factor RimP